MKSLWVKIKGSVDIVIQGIIEGRKRQAEFYRKSGHIE